MLERGIGMILLSVFIGFGISSCATIQNRRYNRGIAVNWTRQTHSRIDVEEIKHSHSQRTGTFTAIVQQHQQEFRGEQANDCNKDSGTLLKEEEKIIDNDYKPNTLDLHSTSLNISHYKEHLFPLTDSLNKKKQDVKSEIPEKNTGNIALTIILICSFLLIFSILGGVFMIGIDGFILLLIGTFSFFGIIAAYGIAYKSLIKHFNSHKKSQDYESAKSARAIGIVWICIFVACLFGAFIWLFSFLNSL